MFEQINSLAFLFGQRVSESGRVDKDVFGQSFNWDDFLFVLNVEGIKVSPKSLLFKSLKYWVKYLFYASQNRVKLRLGDVAFKNVLDDFLIDFLFRLSVILVEFGKIGSFGEDLNTEEFWGCIDSGVGLFFFFFQFYFEGGFDGVEGFVEEVIHFIGRIREFNVVSAVSNPGRDPLQRTDNAFALFQFLEHSGKFFNDESIRVFLHDLVIVAVTFEFWNDFEEMQRTECVLDSEVLGFSGFSIEEFDASLLDAELFEAFDDFLMWGHFELLTHFFDLFHLFFLFFELLWCFLFSGVAGEEHFDSFFDLFVKGGFVLG